jgi:hypothetical protein
MAQRIRKALAHILEDCVPDLEPLDRINSGCEDTTQIGVLQLLRPNRSSCVTAAYGSGELPLGVAAGFG